MPRSFTRGVRHSNVLSVTQRGLTCTGATPVFCHPYYSGDGDAGVGHRTSAAATCGPGVVGGGLRMAFRFDCDDANDGPAGNVCTRLDSRPFNQRDGTQCTPACVDRSADPRYLQLCKQDFQCGPAATCQNDGTCARPAAI